MKCAFLFLLCVFLSCGVDPTPKVTYHCGDLTYSSLIGSTWYCDENLASVWDDLTHSSHCVEKWKFYADSIVVIATHYNSQTMMALDQYKYIAELSQIDRIWDRASPKETWRTTTSYWTQQCRSGSSCDWTDMFSFCTGPFELAICDVAKTDTIGFGDFEHEFYYYLTKTPTQLVYPQGWIGFACGYTIQ